MSKGTVLKTLLLMSLGTAEDPGVSEGVGNSDGEGVGTSVDDGKGFKVVLGIPF